MKRYYTKRAALKELPPGHRMDVPQKNRPPTDYLLFVNEYMTNGQNGTRAYLKYKPHVKYVTAEVEACRLLRNPIVIDELTRRVQAEKGVTREMILSDLMMARQWATDAKDANTVATISMDMAKLAGFLIDKQEVKRIDEHDGAAIRQMVNSAMTQPAVLPQNG